MGAKLGDCRLVRCYSGASSFRRQWVRVRIGHDGGDKVADFCFGTGAFATVEGLDGELDHELVRRENSPLGGPLDPIPTGQQSGLACSGH